MTTETTRLRAALQDKGLWQDRDTAMPMDHGPWYMRIFLGAAAWLAACLLLPFLGIVLIDIDGMSHWIGFACAVACCAIAVPLLRMRKGDFLTQLGCALSLAGLALAATQTWPSDDGPGWLSFGLVAAVMYWLGPVVNHRFVCALAIALAIFLALGEPFESEFLGWQVVLLAGAALLIWCAQLRLGFHPRWQGMDAMAWAFAVVSSALAWGMVVSWPAEGAMTVHVLLASGMCALAPLAVWWRSSAGVFAHPEKRWPAPRVVPGVVLLALAPVWLTVPGVALGLCWLILGFALGRMVLLGLGGVVMLAHLAMYYYQTHTTLLEKSASLCVAGGVLLGMAVLAGKWQERNR